jgi:tetratricopeptide (TPR) repeat protein
VRRRAAAAVLLAAALGAAAQPPERAAERRLPATEAVAVERAAAEARERLEAGEPEAADAVFRRAEARLANAPAEVRAELALRQGDLLAAQVQDAGSVEVEEALDAYRRTIELGTPAQAARARNNRGVLRLQVGPPDAAVRELEAVDLGAVPAAERHLYRYNLGRALEAANRSGEAVDRYLEAIRLDPSYAPASRRAAGALLSGGEPGLGQAADLARLLLDGEQYRLLEDTLRPLAARWPRPELLAPWVAALAVDPPDCAVWTGEVRRRAPGGGRPELAPWLAELDAAFCRPPRLPATADPGEAAAAVARRYPLWRGREDTAAALAALEVALGDGARRAGGEDEALARYFVAWRLEPGSAVATERCALVLARDPDQRRTGGDAVLRALLAALGPERSAGDWSLEDGGSWRDVMQTHLLLAEAVARRSGEAARDEERRHLEAAAEAERRWIEAGGRPSAGLHLRRAAAEASPAARGDAVLRAAEIFVEQGDLAQATLLTATAPTWAAAMMDTAALEAIGEAAWLRAPVELDARRLASLERRLAEAWVAEGEPSITGGAPLAGAGAELCVCGRFPRPEHAFALRLDETPLSPAAVRRDGETLHVTLPADLAPGRHTVAGDPAAGFAAGDGWSFELIRVSSRLDGSERIQRGGRGKLILTVEGTRSPIELELRNRNPDLVRLKGGTVQTVRTSGGRNNSVSRRLQGLGRAGTYRIDPELSLPSCPCAR